MSTNLTAAELARLQQVADRDEIRQLAYRYAWCLDSRNIDELSPLFVGSTKAADRIGESMAAVGVTILFVGNHIIDFDSNDEAHGLVYCRALVVDPHGDGADRMIEQCILYRDTYRRVDGVWKFDNRVHELWFGVELARNPLDQAPAQWPLRHDGLGTVPYDEPSWKEFWDGR